jgi:hypothetical protein
MWLSGYSRPPAVHVRRAGVRMRRSLLPAGRRLFQRRLQESDKHPNQYTDQYAYEYSDRYADTDYDHDDNHQYNDKHNNHGGAERLLR